MKTSLSVNFERFTLEGLSNNPGNFKLWESPGISGGLPSINYPTAVRDRLLSEYILGLSKSFLGSPFIGRKER
jgi:hypothetical protein